MGKSDTLRRVHAGEYMFNRRKFWMHKAAAYVGLQIGHAVLGYIVLWLVLWGVFFLVYAEPIRDKIGQQLVGAILALLLSSTLISVLTQMFAKYGLMKDRRVWHFRGFALYDLVMLFVQAASGLITAAARLVTLLGFLVVQYIRLDLSSLSEKLQPLDPGYHSYIATLMLDHFYNNPVCVVFTELVRRDMKTIRKRAKKAFLDDLPEDGTRANKLVKLARGDAVQKPGILHAVAGTGSAASPGIEMRSLGESKEDAADVESGAVQVEAGPASPRRRVLRNRWWLWYLMTKHRWLTPHRAHNIVRYAEARAGGNVILGKGKQVASAAMRYVQTAGRRTARVIGDVAHNTTTHLTSPSHRSATQM